MVLMCISYTHECKVSRNKTNKCVEKTKKSEKELNS